MYCDLERIYELAIGDAPHYGITTVLYKAQEREAIDYLRKYSQYGDARYAFNAFVLVDVAIGPYPVVGDTVALVTAWPP